MVKWVQRTSRYLMHSAWPLIAFQPVLYLFVWGACIRIWLDKSYKPPAFEKLFGTSEFYHVWMSIGLITPIVSLAAWAMIRFCSGRVRFNGMWLRLAADIGMFTCLLTYHVALMMTVSEVNARPFARYLQGATLIFVLLLVIRDVWTLVLTERLARYIHDAEGS